MQNKYYCATTLICKDVDPYHMQGATLKYWWSILLGKEKIFTFFMKYFGSV